MLKKRTRSKQALLMAETNQKQSKTTSFPLLFTAFSSFKSLTENDAVASPTSILDTKPFGSENPNTHKPEPKRIGLAIIDSLIQEENQEPGLARPISGTVLFGSQIRIRVSDPPRSSSEEKKKPVSGSDLEPDRIFTGYSDIELSEDYTCVTCHGPNPRTIHIFDDCIVESKPGVVFFRSSDPVNESDHFSPDSFLSKCCKCKKNLGPRDDIFMYRGERAFCSSECRSLEMVLDENNI
ncbi:unnamed protein product [Cochlearia groenlandica]